MYYVTTAAFSPLASYVQTSLWLSLEKQSKDKLRFGFKALPVYSLFI